MKYKIKQSKYCLKTINLAQMVLKFKIFKDQLGLCMAHNIFHKTKVKFCAKMTHVYQCEKISRRNWQLTRCAKLGMNFLKILL